MADYPDGIQPTSATIQADTTGLALDVHIYNSTDNLSVYDHLKDVREKIDDYLGDGKQIFAQTINADETSAQSITLDTVGHTVVSVYAKATTATTFTIDVSNDNTNWVNYYTTASTSGETEHTDNLGNLNAFRYVKLSSAAAGSSGDTVTLIVSAK